VFWVFETDPHAFRLATEWTGVAFTYVMTNGVLLGQQASEAVRLDHGHLLGKPTNRRCRMRVRVVLTDEERQKAADELTNHRSDLYRRAVDYVERNCDESVRERRSRLARLNSNGDHRLSTAVFNHLTTGFAERTPTEAKANQFLSLLMPILDSAGPDTLPAGSPDSAAPAQGWAYWLQKYRECLDVLRGEFVLPGHIYRAGLRTETTVSPAGE
jgi:hypothetical protein